MPISETDPRFKTEIIDNTISVTFPSFPHEFTREERAAMQTELFDAIASHAKLGIKPHRIGDINLDIHKGYRVANANLPANLSTEDQQEIAINVLAFVERQYNQITNMHKNAKAMQELLQQLGEYEAGSATNPPAHSTAAAADHEHRSKPMTTRFFYSRAKQPPDETPVEEPPVTPAPANPPTQPGNPPRAKKLFNWR
jgi:hypothetical protein